MFSRLESWSILGNEIIPIDGTIQVKNDNLPRFISGWWFGTREFYFSIQLGMSSSQLTFTPSFFRGVG
jgi:hypothetical protein